MGNKTCDIVYVQPHWRGFAKGKAYPISAYWRGNGSAYRGGHAPVRAESRYNNVGSKIGLDGHDVESGEFLNAIRDAMNNVPTPETFLKKVEEVQYEQKLYDRHGWMRQSHVVLDGLSNASQYGKVGKEVYLLDRDNGGYMRDINGKKIPMSIAYNGILHETPGGSTVCVDEIGLIAGLAVAEADTLTHRTLLEKARSAGGYMYDAYEQDHEFMIAAGFVPVAWIHTDPKDYPDGFDPNENKSCDRIFYVVATRCHGADARIANDMTLNEWKRAVKPCKDGVEAAAAREAYLTKSGEIAYREDAVLDGQDRRWSRPPIDTMAGTPHKKTKEMTEELNKTWGEDWEEEFDYEDLGVF